MHVFNVFLSFCPIMLSLPLKSYWSPASQQVPLLFTFIFCLFACLLDCFETYWVQFELLIWTWVEAYLLEQGQLTTILNQMIIPPLAETDGRGVAYQRLTTEGGSLWLLPHPWWTLDWPHLVQVLCWQPQLLSVHEFNSHTISKDSISQLSFPASSSSNLSTPSSVTSSGFCRSDRDVLFEAKRSTVTYS